MGVFFGLLSFILVVLLILAGGYYFQAKSDLKTVKEEATLVQQKSQATLARYQSIADLEKYKTEIENKLRGLRAVLPKFQTLADVENHKSQLETNLAELGKKIVEQRAAFTVQETSYAQLVAQTEAVEETLEIQSFGFYRPKYGFENSEHYKQQISLIREQQKSMIKSNTATQCPQQWTVDGSVTKGRKMVKEQAKLMLRAFNGECDASIAKVKYNNVNNLETRINKSFDAINKLGESKQLWITREYLNAKLQELFLVHEHREKLQAEREEQRRIKQQMREEEKAIREIEKAKKEAEEEETAKTKALEQAQRELSESHGQQTDRLKTIVDKLEAELKDALERKAKAIARAQLTRSGHVYVLSNVGSFGEGVYKIGMTRRLEPLERVKELGDASVPFPYDVHAMIYSEDAPALESALHKHFASRMVNLSNTRREFFRVSLGDIREAVKEHFGEITFVSFPEAQEYRQSLSIQKEYNETEINATIT